MNRAFSTLTLKTVDESARIVEGIASTLSVDLVGDVVEPEGAVFSLPLPFLMHHDSRLPVGHVTWAKPNRQGIPVRIQLAKTDTPGSVKDRLDAAWQEIRLGLVRGLSIGFKALESVPIAGGGQRFTKWRWLELSGVVIPANQDASIVAVKSFAGAAGRQHAPSHSLRGARSLSGGLVVPSGSVSLSTTRSRSLLPAGARATPRAKNLGSRKLQ